MRRKAFLAAGAVIYAVCALFAAAAAQAPAPLDRTANLGEVLRRGQQLETERRWGDALAHYEDAVRQFPEEPSLERRFELSRLHYDLARRYNDPTFCDCLTQLSGEQALDLYVDLLLKIQAHYVETPDWRQLVERGMNDLDVALSEPTFVSRNVQQSAYGAIDAFREELHRTLGSRAIQSRADAREAARVAAILAQTRLGILPSAVVLEFTCGATTALDPYSSYLTPGQLGEVYSQIEGNFVGLGVELKAADRDLLVVRVIPNSPAQQGGIRAGDRIIAIGDRQVRNYPMEQAANFLQGPAGSVVEVSVVTPGQEPRRLAILRQRVDVPSIDEVRIVDPAQGVAYLKLVCFQKNTSRDLDLALWQLHREGMRVLIIDLRGNPGGLLSAAVDVVDKFVDRGIIVSTRGRNSQEDFTYSAREDGTWHVPLVLLIDQDSASAAEILAGAIRDHHRGTIVGVRSYGKGSVQGIFPLKVANCGVRLTTAKFYSPAGKPFSRVGVEPNVVVRQTAKPAENSATPADDVVLGAALQQAAAQLAVRFQ
jgi:carboxyl-terminal processing protease